VRNRGPTAWENKENDQEGKWKFGHKGEECTVTKEDRKNADKITEAKTKGEKRGGRIRREWQSVRTSRKNKNRPARGGRREYPCRSRARRFN